MVFGDSNAYRPGNGRDSWPEMLQRLSGKTLCVINESCDGRTTHYDTGERNGLKVIVKKIRRAVPLDCIMLALGTNDVKSKYGPPDVSHVVEGIDNIIQKITSYNAGATLILLTPPPLGNVTIGDLANAQGRIPPLAAAYRLFAEKNNILLIDIYKFADLATDLEPDSIHLNKSGRKKVADVVWASIKEYGDGISRHRKISCSIGSSAV
jgi:lysophospholipase L1-like esterase